MNVRKKNQRVPRQRMTVPSAQEFAAKIANPIEELSTLIRNLSSESAEHLTKKFRKEHLIFPLPSPCYCIPFPFLAFNAEMYEETLTVDWTWEDRKHRGKNGWTAFANDPEASYYIFMGFDMDRLNKLEPGKIHLVRKRWAPKNIITTCVAEHVSIEEALQYWTPTFFIDNFIQRVNLALTITRRELTIDEAMNWP